MIRTLFFLLLLGIVSLGLAWFADRPGDILITWQGYRIETSVAVAVAVVALLTLLLMLVWTLTRFIFRVPAIMSYAARGRRQATGYAALSRGLVAVGAGNQREAQLQARDAQRLLGAEPLTLLLQAQAAQLSGDRPTAEATFSRMLEHPEARALGHRGLHIEALRRGDDDAAHHHALEAQKISAAPWAADAVFDRLASRHDWAAALALAEKNAKSKRLDKAAANRQRAVLKTAMALDMESTDAVGALALAREAARLAPGLVPAVTLAARLMQPARETRKAERLIEDAWRIAPHPDLAGAYIAADPGASNKERLARARALARLAPDHAESALAVAKTAVAARNFSLARETLAPLLDARADGHRPSARVCLLMAELEEAADSPVGLVREWLGRAGRAPRDATWMADGVTSGRWLPVSPVTGRLDAFVWQAPPADLSAIELAPAPEPAPAPPLPAPLPAPLPEAALEALEAPPLPKPAQEAVTPPALAAATPSAAPPLASPPVPDDPGPRPDEDEVRPRRGWFS